MGRTKDRINLVCLNMREASPETVAATMLGAGQTDYVVTASMLDDIYNKKILGFAADIPRIGRLDSPDGSAKAHSKLCGSTVSVDLKVENGEFTWDNDIAPGGELNFVRSPLGLHDASQVTGTPLFEADRFMVKFHNLWTIEAPEGYALLFTHPANRFDLPFTTLTGLVDSDRYYDNWIHFPAHWHDMNFSGVLPKGTPIAQCMPVKRDKWDMRTAAFTADESQRLHDLTTAMYNETGIYRRQFRA